MNNTEEQKTDQFEAYNPEISDVERWLQEGEEKLRDKLYSEAIQVFEKILRVDPENMSAYEKLSISRSGMADLERIEDYLATGRELMKHGDWRGAREEFLAVLDIDSEHPEARERLGLVEKHHSGSGESFDVTPIAGIQLGGDSFHEPEQQPAESDTNQETEVFRPVKAEADVKTQPDQSFQDTLENALRYYETDNFTKAQNVLQELQRSYPDHPQIQFYLTAIERRQEAEDIRKNQFKAEEMLKKGMDFLEKENYTEARQIFSSLLSLRPDFAEAQVMLEKTEALIKAVETGTVSKAPAYRKSESAKGASSAAVRPEKQAVKPTVRHTRGRSLGVKILYSAIALTIITGIALAVWYLVIYPGSQYETFLAEARQHMENQAFLKARPLIESALSIQPDSQEALMLLGHVMMETKNPDRAVVAYQSALIHDPDNEEILFQLGRAHFASLDWIASEETFRKISRDPEHLPRAQYYIAMSLKNRQHLDLAVEMFENLLEQDYADADVYFSLANSYAQLNRAQEAEEAYRKAIETDPRFVGAYTVLADFLRQRKEFSKGIDVLQSLLEWHRPTTVELSKEIAGIMLTLGEMQHEAGRFSNAVETFSEVIRIGPNIEAYRYLGRSYYRMERLPEAIMVWRQGLDIDRTDADLWWQIGVAQFRQGDLNSAETSYKEALRYDSNHFRSLTNLGFLYHQLYKYELARRYWRRSLDIEPNQPRVRDMLKSIDR